MTVRVDSLQREGQEPDRTSSKGNQNKWKAGGKWYKEDGLGYEALAEVLISRLLEKTNIETFVPYAYTALEKEGKLLHGCCSEDFMEAEDDKVISVERLFQTFYGGSAAKLVLPYTEPADRIRYVAESVEKVTGLQDFGGYLRRILTIDALFLNEDRHFHNLAVIQRLDGTYRFCPIFDNGAALFSDTRSDYPLDMDLEQCYARIEAKPFSRDFDEQLDACEMLYGSFRFRANFGVGDVERILGEFKGIYEVAVLERVLEIMRRQIRKYGYLFSR